MPIPSLIQKVNRGEYTDTELGINERPSFRMGGYNPLASTGSLALDTMVVYRSPKVNTRTDTQPVKRGVEILTGGIKPVKAQIAPVPPTGVGDAMPQTPVATATITAPAPLPAMDTKTEEKTAAAPKSKTMLYVGIAAAVLIGGYFIMKK